jgi:outer membrane receptor for ferrienterochelin and colicins
MDGKPWLRSLLALLMLSSSSVAGGAGISGQVIIVDSGQPLAATNVIVSDLATAATFATVSDAEGHFAFDGLAPGSYQVSATHVGFQSDPREVNITADRPAILLLQMVARPIELDETVVSASRLPERVLDAPVSVTRMDGAQVRRNAGGHSYINDLRHVRGIDYQQLGLFQERFAARGLNAAFNKRMLLITDGRVTESSGGSPYYNPATTKDDVRDIEVITGPGSALYGPDAVSGIISLRTRDPRNDQSTTAAISGGTRELFKGRVRHAELFNGKWGWKVSGEYQSGRDFELANTYYTADSTFSVTETPDFDTDIIVGGIGLYYYPDDSSTVRATAGATRVNGISQSTLTGRVQVIDSYYHYQQVAYETPSLYLSAYNTGADVGDSFLLDQEARYRLAGTPPQQARDLTMIRGKSALREVEARYRFGVSAWPQARFIVGSAWRQQHQQANFIRNGDVTLNQFGVYGYAETTLTAGLRGVLASRLDWHEDYGSQVSPKVALVYAPRDRMTMRASLNRAFKSPTVLEQHILTPAPPPAVIRGNRDGFRFGSLMGDPLPAQYQNGIAALEPEQNTTVELGFKGALSDRLFIDISGYRSRYENFSSPFTTPIGDLAAGIVTLDDNGELRSGEVTLTTVNFGKLAVIGLDLGANAYLTERIILRGNTSLIDAGDLEDGSGMEMPFNTPGVIVKLGVSADDLVFSRTAIDLSARYVAEHDFREAQDGGTVPSYTVVDLGLGYEATHGIHYRVSVQNLLGNRHREFFTGPRIGRLSVFEIQYAM